MEYKVIENNEQVSSVNLQLNSTRNKLTWSNEPNMDYILLRVPFDIEVDIEGLFKHITDDITTYYDRFENIREDIYIRYISRSQKVRKAGCDISFKGCRYILLHTNTSNDVINIYIPNNKGRRRDYICEVPLSVDININKGMVQRRFLLKKEIITYYSINFKYDFIFGYSDGDLYYTVKQGGQKENIPITKAMIEAKTVYVKNCKPVISSRNKRISFTIKEY